jgi:peptidoglycan hydrolase-like protein with peptidoglycan-binding domain
VKEMVLIRHGDHDPKVVAVQILLNRHGPGRLKVDGRFGDRTYEAVVHFQRVKRLKPDGVVGPDTWDMLTKGERLCVVDSVDITDPDLEALEASDLKRAGSWPLLSRGMTNSIPSILEGIRQHADLFGPIVLLRFHGHAAPGKMATSMGDWTIKNEKGQITQYLDPDAEKSGLTLRTVNELACKFWALNKYFVDFGSVELMGCNAGQGIAGSQLLHALADNVGVPVSAGPATQYGGGACTFRIEGPIRTAFPGGGNLRSWAESRQEAHQSVMAAVP